MSSTQEEREMSSTQEEREMVMKVIYKLLMERTIDIKFNVGVNTEIMMMWMECGPIIADMRREYEAAKSTGLNK